MSETMYSIKVNRDKFDYVSDPTHSILNHWPKAINFDDIEPGTKIRYICKDTQRTVVREVKIVNRNHPALKPDWFETIDEFVN